jgi:hypothetical protein
MNFIVKLYYYMRCYIGKYHFECKKFNFLVISRREKVYSLKRGSTFINYFTLNKIQINT